MQNKNYFLLVLAVVYLLPTQLEALNLKRSVVTALARAEETKIASSQVRQAQIALELARGGNNSVLALSSKMGPAYQSTEAAGDDTFVYADAGFTWTKPLLNGELTRFQSESSQLQMLATQYQSRSVLERTSVDVIEAYLDVVFQQEKVRSYTTHIAEFRRIEQITEARRDNGVATEADVLLVRARVITANAALNRARLDLARSQSLYNILVGPVENDMILPLLVDDIFFENYELLAEKLRNQNSILQQGKYQSRVALADLNSIIAEESIVLTGSVEGKYATTLGGGVGDVLDLGAYLNLSYQTTFGGIHDLSVGRQQERIRELNLLNELQLRDLEFELQDSYSNYQSLKKVLSATERELQANRGVLEAQKEQQKIGQVELSDVLNNQDRVNSTYIRLLDTRQDDHLIRYQMLVLIGEILSLFTD